MDLFNHKTPILLASLILFTFSLPIFSQEIEADKAQTQADQDDPGTYLDRHIAIKRVKKLQDLTIHDIQRLKILIANFGKNVENAEQDFEKIKETYKSAQKLWYKRHYIQSQKLHNDCRNQVFEMFKKFAQMYDKQTSELLSQCSESMVNIEFSQSVAPGNESSYSATIQQNSYKLQIAFQQNHRALAYIDQEDFEDAIHHFRLAKLFAIEVLISLEQDETKKKELDEKYKDDIQDARGFVAQPAKTQ